MSIMLAELKDAIANSSSANIVIVKSNAAPATPIVPTGITIEAVGGVKMLVIRIP